MSATTTTTTTTTAMTHCCSSNGGGMKKKGGGGEEGIQYQDLEQIERIAAGGISVIATAKYNGSHCIIKVGR